MGNIDRLRQYLSKCTFPNGYDKFSAMRCLDEIEQMTKVSDEEINQVANDESQQDWCRMDYQKIYAEAFSDGAKWLRYKMSR